MATTDKNQQPVSTQGNAQQKEEQLGGTTNLSLDQLKKEGDTENPPKDSPNNDDLKKALTADDLDERYQVDDSSELTDESSIGNVADDDNEDDEDQANSDIEYN